jgi:hypothetical protein
MAVCGVGVTGATTGEFAMPNPDTWRLGEAAG